MGKKKNKRKQSKNWINWAGYAALAYFGLTYLGTAVANEISFGKPRLKIKKTTFTGIDATISIPITNNLPISFSIDTFKGEVLYGDKKLSDLLLNHAMVISGGETSVLDIQTVLNFENLATNIVDLIASGDYLQSIYLKGFVVSSGVAYAFKEKFVLI